MTWLEKNDGSGTSKGLVIKRLKDREFFRDF